MYRNQQQQQQQQLSSYSNLNNQGNFQRRGPHVPPMEGVPQTAYFDESPDLNLRQGAVLSMSHQDMQGGYPSWYPEQNHNLPSASSFYNHQSQVSGPLLSGGRQYANLSQTVGQGSLASGQYQQQQPPYMAHQMARVNQSEESGGGQGGGAVEAEPEEFDASDNDINREEPENDIEYIVMNVYSQMKNLEGKYLDLANYYKQELLQQSTTKPSQELEGSQRATLNSQRRQGAQVQQYPLNSPNRERYTEAGKDTPSKAQDQQHEKEILQDLVNQKRKLEEYIQTIVAMRGSMQHQQSPPKFKSSSAAMSDQQYRTNIPSEAQLRFLKSQLSEALDGIVENLDQSQKKEFQYLSSKQNEMYQLASRFNLPAQVKNESLGLWYDAKTKVTTIMQELKGQVQQKKKLIEGNLLSSKINSERVSEADHPGDSLKQQLEQLTRLNDKSTSDGGVAQQTMSPKFLEDFRKELASIKKKQDHHQKLVQKLKGQLKFKEGLLKDEHSKLNSILRDLKQNLNNLDDSKRLMSGEKSNHNLLMSPFERKIATYQKSAEMRKQNGERSGSRGRTAGMGAMSNTGSGFYRINNDFNNPQILNNMAPQQQHNTEGEQDLRVLRQKVKNFELCFDDFTNKLILKNQDISELERQVDSHSQEELKGISQMDNLIAYYSSNQSKAEAVRSKSRSRIQDNHITTSPAGSQGYQSKDQDRKFIELQRNNEQIYQELRKANEKYLNQRVENNKLKDENHILKNNLEEAQLQVRKLTNNTNNNSQSHYNNNDNHNHNNSRSGVRPTSKNRINRYDANQGSSNGFGPSQQRQASNNSSQLQRENEELRKKIQDLEKECYSLTYYQQEMQRRGPGQMDPYARQINQENGDLKNRLDQLCLQVQKFMLAMKRLQRAVNNKDKDIQNLKAEFEKNKKILENMVKEIKEKEESSKQGGLNYAAADRPNNVSAYNQPTNNSIMAGVRDARFNPHDSHHHNHNHHDRTVVSSSMIGIQPLRNRSQAPKDQTGSQFASRQQPYSVTVRNDVQQPSNADLNQSAGNLPPKRQVIRPKGGQQMTYSQNMTPVQPVQRPHYTGAADLNTPEPQAAIPQQLQQQFNQTEENININFDHQSTQDNLMEELKQAQKERDTANKTNEELTKRLRELQALKDKVDTQFKTQSEQMNSLNQTLAQSKEFATKLEQVLQSYKQGLCDLEQYTDDQVVSELKSDLLNREHQVLSSSLNDDGNARKGLRIGSTHSTVQTALSGQVMSSVEMDQLREHLINEIESQRQSQEEMMAQLQERLEEKERELDQVKKLLMDKLKELESSFVELSQDMIEQEQAQLDASKKYHQKQLKQSMLLKKNDHAAANNKHKQLEKSIENIIAGEQDEQNAELFEQIDQLTQLNEQLSEENGELRMIIKQLQKDLQQQDDVMLLRAQYDELQELNDKFEEDIHRLQTESAAAKRSSEQHKAQADKARAEVQELTHSKDLIATSYQKQLDELETQLGEAHLQTRQEQEQRVLYESEHAKVEKLLKQLKSEKAQQDSQREKLEQRERDLLQQIAQLKEEIEHLNSLRRGEVSFETMAEDDKSAQASLTHQADEEETKRIENNPSDAANHYLRLFKATNKEYKIMVGNRDKLQIKFDEMKEKFDTLKSKSRQNVEEIMSMESKIFGLEDMNKRLQGELERTKGSNKEEEEEIRKQVEQQFKDKLKFKDSEIEQMTIKVARISQTNIELTQRINRVSESNQELAIDNEQMRNQLQTLEMELEMTKVNNERDMEQIQQQKEEDKKQIDFQLQAVQAEKQMLEERVNKKKAKIAKIRQDQSQEQIMKDIIRQSMEQKINDMKKQVDKEKELKQEIEIQTQQKIAQAEQELDSLRRQLEEQSTSQNTIKDQQLQDAIRKFEQEKQAIQQQMDEAYQQQMEAFEQQLIEEREAALEALKEQMQKSHQQREEEMVKQMEEAQEQLMQEMQQRQMEQLDQSNQQMRELADELQRQTQQKMATKDKERALIYKLQQHVRNSLVAELNQSIQDNEELKNQIQELQSQNETDLQELAERLEEEQQQRELTLQKQTKLLYKLQSHMRKLLENQLRETLKENEQLKSLMDQTNAQGMEQLQSIKEQLQAEAVAQTQKQQKQTKLVFQLQQHMRQVLLAELKAAEDRFKVLERVSAESERQRVQDMEALETKLQLQRQQDQRQRELETKLIFKLQKHAKRILQDELEEVIEREREQSRLDLERLEELKVEEMRLVEQNLKAELKEEHQQRLKRINKERSLVQVLQAKARDVILRELELERQNRINQQLEAEQQIQELITLKERELKINQQQHEQMIQQVQLDFENSQAQTQEEHENELASLRHESESRIQRQQSEIERLRREQEDLVKSLSEEQDQQTKDLLNQKQREKEALEAEMQSLKQDLETKYSQDLANQTKQQSMMQAMQEKMRQELETKLAEAEEQIKKQQMDAQEQLEQLRVQQSREMEQLQNETQNQRDLVLSEAQQERQKLIDQLEQQQIEAQRKLLEAEQVQEQLEQTRLEQLQQAREDLQQVIDSLQEQNEDQKKYIELLEQEQTDLQQQVQELQSKAKDSTQTIERLETQLEEAQGREQSLQEQFDEQLNLIQQESEQQEQEYQLRIKQLQDSVKTLQAQIEQSMVEKETSLSQARLQHEQLVQELEQDRASELSRLRENLESQMAQSLSKKDQEMTMLESLSNKIKEDLKTQLDEKERAHQLKQAQVQELEELIRESEAALEKERENQIHTIGELNSTIQQTQLQLEEANAKIQELENQIQVMEEQKLQSENELAQSLQERVQDLTNQLANSKKEASSLHQEVTNLKSRLSSKEEEIQNLGEDLEGFAKDLEEQRALADQARSKLEAQKKELEGQLKLKDSQIQQVQQDLQELEMRVAEKSQEAAQESERRQKEKKRAIDLEAQIKALQQTHEEEIESVHKQNSDLKLSLEKLQKQLKQAQSSRADQSLDEIELRLGEFDVELDDLKKQQRQLEKDSKLNRSILGSANKDDEPLEIGDLMTTTDEIQFCKRVKYQDQAWYLFSQQSDYYWINQAKIPLDRLKMIDVQEIEQNQEKMQERIEDLKRQKEHIMQLIQKSKRGKAALDQDMLDGETAKLLKEENQALRNQLDEAQLQNKALQQTTIQLRQQISELNDMFVGLADTDKKSLESITKLVDYHKKNNELNQQLLQQIELINKLENENEALKKQVMDQEPSFARGGGKSFANLRPENFDINTSSIDQQDEEDEGAGNLKESIVDKVNRLEQEIEENSKMRSELENEIRKLRTELNRTKEQAHQSSLSQQDQVKAQEAFESFKLSKDLFSQFIEHIPITAQEHESRLSVLYRVLEFTNEEANALNIKRGLLTQKNIQDNVKKGVLGGLFKKK